MSEQRHQTELAKIEERGFLHRLRAVFSREPSDSTHIETRSLGDYGADRRRHGALRSALSQG